MKSDVLRIESEGAVATVILDRPKILNAFNRSLRRDLLAAVRHLDETAQIRVVILRGEGAGFCAGADLGEEMSGSVRDALENEYKPVLTGIAQSPKIWIASVHGHAAGIGGSLAMACDLMVMAEDASIYLAFAAIGLIPDGGATWLLLQAMGYRRALQTVLEGRKIPAQTCLELGLANEVAPAGSVHEISKQWATRLSQGAPLAQAAAKRVLRRVGAADYGTAITIEADEQQALIETEDFRNGVAAFFAKRKPVFAGR